MCDHVSRVETALKRLSDAVLYSKQQAYHRMTNNIDFSTFEALMDLLSYSFRPRLDV